MTPKTLLLAVASAGIGLSLGLSVPAAASSHYLTGVKDHSFLVTRRQLVLKKTPYRPSITLPQGTVVQVDGVSTGHTTNIRVNTLSYHLRKPYIGNSNLYTQNIPLTTTTFKKVAVPAYTKYYPSQTTTPTNSGLAYIGNGELYQGVKFPEQANQLTAKADRVTVTSDGYLEYYQSTKIFSTTVDPRPTTSVKITKTTGPANGLTTLYTRQAVPSVIGTRVSQSGNAQYAVRIKRLYRTYATVTTTSKDPTATDSVDISAAYQVNGQTYFMYQAVFYPQG